MYLNYQCVSASIIVWCWLFSYANFQSNLKGFKEAKKSFFAVKSHINNVLRGAEQIKFIITLIHYTLNNLQLCNVSFHLLISCLFSAARGACCCLSFTTDSSLCATHPEEILTAGKMLNSTVLTHLQIYVNDNIQQASHYCRIRGEETLKLSV